MIAPLPPSLSDAGRTASPILTVERLGKAYPRDHGQRTGATLLQVASHALNPFKRPRPVDRPAPFWAVRNVSFSVARGEVVGLIGRNGAGKSTLLKVLSRITDPTIGRARLAGRVTAVLDAKTDLIPELTGRENVVFRGAALGMTGRQVRARFDELVAFSGLERFLDTPVRYYSLGMTTRMAFAIAAHLDAELLLVDEVFSFGDLPFREHCVARMRHLAAAEGRAVVLVSQEMGTIRRLCPRAILMDAGRVAADGLVEDVVYQYLTRSR